MTGLTLFEGEGPLLVWSRRWSGWVTAMVNDGSWPERDRSPAIRLSHFSLLGHFESVVYFDAKVSNRALKFGVSKEQLYGA